MNSHHKHNFFILAILSIIFIGITIRTAHATESQQQILERDHIWLETIIPSNSNEATINFRVWFEASPADVFRVLTDTNAFTHQLTNYNDARTLSREIYKKLLDAKPNHTDVVEAVIGSNVFESNYNRKPDHNWTNYVYYRFKFPWPLTDRWAVQNVRIDETNADQGEYKYEYETELGNFKALKGTWQLKPVNGKENWTEFYGSYQTDPGIPAPKIIARPAIKNGFVKDMAGYRRMLGLVE